MKKFILSNFLVLFVVVGLFAQTLVTTEVENKNVVLEEYTGIHCTYCPDGHAIAQALTDENSGRVVLINVHVGNYAVPGAGEPDFRTEFGDALVNLANISGYPAGSVNRHIFPDLSSSGGTGMGRSAWTPAASEIFPEESPVNVGAATNYNADTRELTVTVELYYTSSSPETSNYINVALLQSGIIGPQTGGGMGDNYIHNHMLRHLITGQWGEEITTTTSGTFVEKTYTYTIPENYIDIECIVEDCDVAVFVSEGNEEIYSGVVVPAIDGTTLVTSSISQPDSYGIVGSQGNTSSFDLNITSALSGTEDFTLTLTKENEPENWQSSFTINGNTYETEGTVSLDEATPTALTIDVIPDAEAGFALYTLAVASDNNPNAPSRTINLYVIAGVTNLLVHNQGAWGGGSPVDFEQQYYDAFDYAGMTNYSAVSYKAYMLATSESKLGEIECIYFNVGWTFPGLTNANVEFLEPFLDNGGNLFIAGQDIGWDTWDAAGNGTATTQAFYTDYLNADYQGDGSSADNSVYANPDNIVFGDMTNCSITDIYGGNMYPDEIDPINEGTSIFYYNSTLTKSGAVATDNGTFKVVYLGFSPTMATSAEPMNEIINKTNLFFQDLVPPFVIYTPADGITGILVDVEIELSFSQAVRLIDDSPITDPASLITLKETDANGADVSFSAIINDENNLITITPDDNLAYEQDYYVALGASVEGENDVAISESNTTFTTETEVKIIEINNDIKLFPNPCNSVLNIFVNNAQITNVEIYNIFGKLILKENYNNANKIQINTSQFESGVYVIKIQNDKNIIVEKFTVLY